MNFYKRYMADYAQKTAQLSLAEHGAYTLLLDEFYSTEKPLPADYTALYRICRAMDKREQEAVKFVADKYFPIDENGTRSNPRAAAEITEAAPAMEAARLNGKKGGRPKKEPSRFTENNPVGFENITQTEPNSKPPHSSDNYSLSNDREIVSAKSSRPSKKCPVDFEVTDAMSEWAQREGYTVELFLETKKFKDHTFSKALTDWGGAWRNWVRRAQEFANEKAVNSGAGYETKYAQSQREKFETVAPLVAAKKPGVRVLDPNVFIDGGASEPRKLIAG